MRSISVTEAKQRFGALLDDVQTEPVQIRRRDRPTAIMVSPDEYKRLRSLAVEEFQRFCDRVGDQAVARGLTEGNLGALLACGEGEQGA